MIAIRQATLVDAKRLLEIYDYYVKNTAITFEYDTPSLAEFQSRMERTMKRYPYLVAMEMCYITEINPALSVTPLFIFEMEVMVLLK